MNPSKLQVTDMLVKAFVAEGVEVLFTLMGDANMYWSAAMAKVPGVQVIHARHEHCACSMADGYARATGKVGVASTTCGPGFTQIMTGLAMAARANTPMVVFAGDAPIGASWYLQQIDMAPLALACGAHYVAVKSIDRTTAGRSRVREWASVTVASRPLSVSMIESGRPTSVERPTMTISAPAHSTPASSSNSSTPAGVQARKLGSPFASRPAV